MSAPGKSRIDQIRHQIGLPLAIVLTLAVWFMPHQAGLSVVGQKSLALFVGVFVLYLTEALALPVTSLLIVPAAVLMGIVNIKGALEGFASSSVYLMVGAFILATAMVKTKLAERITYKILSVLGGSFRNITFGVVIANVFLAFLVPSSTARTAILLPVCISIIELFKTEGRSKVAINLLLTLAFTNATISAGILTATVPNPVTIDFIVKAGGPLVSYMDWLIYGFPPALLMTLITWAYIQWVFKPEHKEIPGGIEFIRTKLNSMGTMRSEEWRALSVFIFVVLLWTTGKWTKIDPTTACLAAAGLFFLPKFGVLDWNDANKGISWQIIYVAGGGISLGDILMKTGAAKWLAVTIFKALGLAGSSVLVILVVLMFIIQYMHLLFVGTTAMATAFIPIVLAMAQTANIPPMVLALPAGMIIGGYPLLMFYNTLPNILIYGTGKLRVEDFPRVGVVVCAIGCVVYALCATTYWQWMGMF
ncbi:MAG TPA: DASS family sodium-coupled anion symporter [Negativicutes bacterium]|nr:DASS family sodium-coupled anion symporter [Negativicutes bacterium]